MLRGRTPRTCCTTFAAKYTPTANEVSISQPWTESSAMGSPHAAPSSSRSRASEPMSAGTMITLFISVITRASVRYAFVSFSSCM
jgi:hypothetical protein